MIKVEGYKAFHGVMRFTPKSKCVSPSEIEGDWLYKPDTNCWYCKGVSYPAKLCTVVRDDSEKHIPKKPILDTIFPSGIKWWNCPICKHNNVETNDNFCHNCGQALDWGDEK